MPHTLELFLTILASVLASSGFWALIQKKMEDKDARSQMILGLGHDRIIWLGMSYLNRGWVTNDEYENLVDYLYKPYAEMGGNGTAKRIVDAVKKLPIRSGAAINETVGLSSVPIVQNESGGDS